MIDKLTKKRKFYFTYYKSIKSNKIKSSQQQRNIAKQQKQQQRKKLFNCPKK